MREIDKGYDPDDGVKKPVPLLDYGSKPAPIFDGGTHG